MWFRSESSGFVVSKLRGKSVFRGPSQRYRNEILRNLERDHRRCVAGLCGPNRYELDQRRLSSLHALALGSCLHFVGLRVLLSRVAGDGYILVIGSSGSQSVCQYTSTLGTYPDLRETVASRPTLPSVLSVIPLSEHLARTPNEDRERRMSATRYLLKSYRFEFQKACRRKRIDVC